MDYHELKLLLDLPAVRLVRANNAPLVLGFTRQFPPLSPSLLLVRHNDDARLGSIVGGLEEELLVNSA